MNQEVKPPFKHDRELKWIPVEKIIPNQRNPRRKEHFSPDQLRLLRNSIKKLGILEPVIVEPYKDDLYLLIEGERRVRSARLENAKEVPAVVVNRLDEHDQVVVMFNIHTNRRGWEMAEELTAIKELIERNGHLTEPQLAAELNMSSQKLRERMTVLDMGDQVIAQIAKGDIDYSSALRTRQVAKSMQRQRPEIVEKLGGSEAVERKLLRKAKERHGISQELVVARRELTDPEQLNETAVVEYIEKPETTIRQVRTKAMEEARKVEGLSKELRHVERQIRTFDADLADVPNLRVLRGALSSLIDAAQGLEASVVEALMERAPDAV